MKICCRGNNGRYDEKTYFVLWGLQHAWLSCGRFWSIFGGRTLDHAVAKTPRGGVSGHRGGPVGKDDELEDSLQEGLSGVGYITPCLLSHKPISLLVVMLGTNDTKERFGASAACIALGLKRLLQKAIATDCWEGSPDILIVAPKSIEKEYESTFVAATMGRGCAEKSRQLAGEYREIAKLLGCHFMDANDYVSAYNRLDFMHLTAEGHRELSEALEKKIKNIFR